MQKYPMTVEGAEKLRIEVEKLKKEKPLISQAIATAREHGDLKENAEVQGYDLAGKVLCR